MQGVVFPGSPFPVCAIRKAELSCFLFVHSSAALFVKPHFVLIVAAAAVLLIDRRSYHGTVCSRNHAGMISLPASSMAELLHKTECARFFC